MNHNLNLLFFLRGNQTRTEGLSTIYLRITINGERAELSTKRKVDSFDSDAKRQRAKGRSENARILNDYLDKMEIETKRCYNILNDEE